ncbi:MAG: O-methyltransferase [Saprospiraceae bacterium]|nr:O-methyltransferase [Saprospiraceae bacterium]
MIDENILRAIYSYCENVSDDQGDVLYQLYRETHLKTMAPRMASGPIQGRLLSLLSNLQTPNHILEIGTFTGYATICMAEGLAEDGQITTIEVNPELNHISDKYFKIARIRDRVTSLIGNAKEIIPTLDGPFDFVFIDAKKKDYSLYFDLIIDKVAQGGIILADNVLWDGKVIDGSQDATSQSLREFNQKMKENESISTLLLPLRDGLMIMRKK